MAYLPKQKDKRLPWVRKPKPQHWGMDDHQALYKSPRWKRFRECILDNDPFCRECNVMGWTTLATVCDHIRPARLWPELFWDDKNCQGLCKKHHNAKSRIERECITQEDWMNKLGHRYPRGGV